MLSHTVVFVEEAEEGAGRELKRSKAECARAGLDTAGLLLLSGTHPPPLDTAGLGAGASSRNVELVVLILSTTHFCTCFFKIKSYQTTNSKLDVWCAHRLAVQ